MQRLLNTVGLCGAGGAGRATGSNHTMSQGEKLARNLHDICAMLRPLRFFWQHGPWWRRPARLAGAHKLHKNHWSYSVHKCTDVDRCRMNILCVCVCQIRTSIDSPWVPDVRSVPNATLGGVRTSMLARRDRAYPARSSKVQMRKRSNHLPPTALAHECRRQHLSKINFFWPTKSSAIIRAESWLRTKSLKNRSFVNPKGRFCTGHRERMCANMIDCFCKAHQRCVHWTCYMHMPHSAWRWRDVCILWQTMSQKAVQIEANNGSHGSNSTMQ